MTSKAETQYFDVRRTQADVNLGQAVAAARLRAGLSQAELAERLTGTTQTPWSQVKVSNIETSRRLMTISQLCQVADVLGMTTREVTAAVSGHSASETRAYHQPRAAMPKNGYPLERVR